MSLLNKHLNQKVNLILQTKLFWNVKLGYDVDQVLSQARPGDFTYNKWICLMGNKKLTYPQVLFELCEAYRCMSELFDIKRIDVMAEILLREAAKFGHPRAVFEVTSIPLWDLYGKDEVAFDLTMLKVRELSNMVINLGRELHGNN